ncbi:hypothetical protein [Phenylobacterium immobile]|uniref:hypothetical protein n=1 Tax=Phenylobacterium immobile TaxID=21 RepID=UPI000ADA7FC9|nr:hypothetical protein [Phenylobacterium immobile]
MKSLKALVVSAILAVVASPAAAQAAVSQDVSCLVLSMAPAQSTNLAIKQNGLMAQSYFMGRLDARDAANLSALLNAQVVGLTPERGKAENARCTMLIDNRITAMRATLSRVKSQAGV